MAEEKAQQILKYAQKLQNPVSIYPKNTLTFTCSPAKTSANLKFFIKHKYLHQKYRFTIKTTNKQGYKVSQPQGTLHKVSEYDITIYIKKQVDRITHNLKDKFQVTVIDQNTKVIVLKEQLKIAIQSGIEGKEQIRMDGSNSANVTRLASVYYNSMDKISINSSAVYGDRIKQHLTTIAESGQDTFKKQETMKSKLNSSIQQIQEKKRKLLMLDRQIKNQNAQARFNKYIIVLVFIVFFLLGVYCKRIQLFDKIGVVSERFVRYVQRKSRNADLIGGL